MLYQKSVLGRKYTRLLTGSPVFFLTYVLCGVILFMVLTLTTRINVVESYSAEVMQVESELVLFIKVENLSMSSAFIYSNKNEAVYHLPIERTEIAQDGVLLHFDIAGQDRIKTLIAGEIFIDFPQGQETLFYRIFVKGGRGRG